MRFSLLLGPLEVPDDRFAGFFAPAWPEASEAAETLVRAAIDYPLGPHLRDMASEGCKVLLLVEDQTRPTPLTNILPPVLDELFWAGVAEEDIRIVVAGGAHRPMAAAERNERLGAFAHDFEVLDHHPDAGLSYLGTSPHGLPLFLDTALFEADLIIGISRVMPHRVFGYSGGSTILSAGAAGRLTLGELHWLSAEHSAQETLGIRETPAREESDAIASLMRLDFLVNVILGEENEIVAATAGHPLQSHQEACHQADAIFRVPLDPAPIVVVQPGKGQRLLNGSLGALYSAECAVKEGGTIVLVDPYLRLDPKLRYPPLEEVLKGTLEDRLQASHLAHLAWTKQKARIVLVSPQSTAEVAQGVGLGFAPTPQAGLERAMEETGGEILVLDAGGEIVPIPE